MGWQGRSQGLRQVLGGKKISGQVECDREPEEMTRGAEARKLRLVARVAGARAGSMASPSASAWGCPPRGRGSGRPLPAHRRWPVLALPGKLHGSSLQAKTPRPSPGCRRN